MGDKNGYLPYPKGFATAVCHYAQEADQWTSSEMTVPISMTVAYKLSENDIGKEEYNDTSYRNPTRNALEKLFAHLEKAKYCACFPSGTAALTACISLLKYDEHLICLSDIYGGTRKTFTRVASKFGIQTTFIDSDPEAFERAIRPNTKMIWVESLTNPSLDAVDVKAFSEIAKKHKLLLIVDNTFLTPYLHRPLDFGADISLHSVSKYLNGHTDIVMGAIMTNDEKIFDQIQSFQKVTLTTPSPFDCYHVLRGIKTLPARMKQHAESSLQVARFLEAHPKIEKVIHPGLPSYPKDELMKRQTSGYCGMVTFYLKGNIETSHNFLKSLKLISHAGSLGGYQSVVELPTEMSHFSVPVEEKKKLQYLDTMVRFSVGLEDPDDIIEDLRQAFENI